MLVSAWACEACSLGGSGGMPPRIIVVFKCSQIDFDAI